MIGLEREILERKTGKKISKVEKFSISYIAKLLGMSYMGVKNKLHKNQFFVEEALAIFTTLIPTEKQTMEMFQYLFEWQND